MIMEQIVGKSIIRIAQYYIGDETHHFREMHCELLLIRGAKS